MQACSVTLGRSSPFCRRKTVSPWRRLVNAKRIAAPNIPGKGKRPGPAAAADIFEFTQAAFPLQQREVAHAAEDRGVAVYVRQRLRPDIAADQVEKAAGLDIALVRDKQDPFAVVDAEG